MLFIVRKQFSTFTQHIAVPSSKLEFPLVFDMIVCCNKRLIMACSMFMSLLLQYVTLYVICHQLKMKNLFSSLLVVHNSIFMDFIILSLLQNIYILFFAEIGIKFVRFTHILQARESWLFTEEMNFSNLLTMWSKIGRLLKPRRQVRVVYQICQNFLETSIKYYKPQQHRIQQLDHQEQLIQLHQDWLILVLFNTKVTTTSLPL